MQIEKQKGSDLQSFGETNLEYSNLKEGIELYHLL